ncbi:MAG: tetratricopeptide repeat protein [Candidatus Cloacimonadota bacterium]|jgi:tetratricopeptide (TPR) repeat protein|nr:tetratricopeptide repeat protein [Candidatus Cloacimonas sp.]MDI9572199.1 tetratricopeptide repeat protein [Candidatus Cloacimonadota bacterium]HOM79760.1 tetratricopeptide repeat protein [Candidatus Cloacimonas acidaminovorans]NLM91225.1 tetratricopeptide repeat protein [Candidatus Cloacimonadota bacterium]HPC50414.1 tetratricopeptide repeat protein [Candidatus Cloacimonas acidaminovorans]
MSTKTRRNIIIIIVVILALLILELIFRPKVVRQAFAEPFYRAKKYPQAENLFRKNSTKNDAPANANLAKCLYRQNRFAEADSAATIALNSAKDKKDILYDRGNIAYKQQDYSKALRDYKEALLLNPEDDDLRANYELTLRKMNKQPPPAVGLQQNKDDKKKEAIRNILEGLDNKESTDRQQLRSKQSLKTDKWW